MDRNRPFATFAVVCLLVAGCAAGEAMPTARSAVTPPASEARVAVASPSPEPGVAGCVPECLVVAGAPRRLVGPGPFTTTYFFAGAFIINLDAGWTVEDGATELIFEHPGSPDWFIFAWIDPYPVSNLHRVEGVERTPDALIAWLHTNPTLIATAVPATTVAGGLPAAAIDLRASDKATLEYLDCPDICTNYLGFENGPDAHGIARPGVTRLYFAPIMYGRQTHLLTISYEALDEAGFAAELNHAKELIDTIRMPVQAAP